MYSVTTRTPAELSPIGSGKNVRWTVPAAARSCSSQEVVGRRDVRATARKHAAHPFGQQGETFEVLGS